MAKRKQDPDGTWWVAEEDFDKTKELNYKLRDENTKLRCDPNLPVHTPEGIIDLSVFQNAALAAERDRDLVLERLERAKNLLEEGKSLMHGDAAFIWWTRMQKLLERGI